MIDDRDFERFRALVRDLSGIHLTDNKRALLAARLGKRLRHHGLTSFAAYHEHLRRDPGELVELVNAITTNKTEFFREPHHFDFLRERILPELRERGDRRLSILSAGCSTGEEPYSIAMTVRDHLPGWDVEITACDIDTQVLEQAQRGVYADDKLEALPAELVRRHFLRGTGAHAGSWRARPELRSLITFRRVNLTADRWPFARPFDVVFCRNVVIYFDQATQRRIFERFARTLARDGWLFVGHSESMIGVSTAFTLVGQTVHRLAAADAGPATFGTRRLAVGEIHATRTPTQISTVLGSCVSACLFDPVSRVGGMNHFLLPRGEAAPEARYGVHAMEALVDKVLALGADPARLVAKVAGANNVIAGLDGSVAEENQRFVRAFLRGRGIPLVGERLGGTRALEAHFLTDSGRLYCRDVVTT